ncbi:hypothetical protein EV122DRAFT_256801 [Schizophyllum commune]
MFAVASPTIEENVRKFDIGKCLLVHFTRNQRKCTPTPMHVAGQTVEAVDSAKYLGMILDRRLRFHEQVEAAVAKGTAATMAIARLTRPTLGLPHKHERQLYRAVVIPKVEYAAPVWYNPIRPRDTGKGRKGSVRFARQIGRVQRLAARLICGGFPCFETVDAMYTSSETPSPPMYLHNIETIDATPIDPTWNPDFTTHIARNKDDAAAELLTTLRVGPGGIGAAAVLMLPDGRSEELMVYLGPNTEHIVVYDGELAGAILATELADHLPHARSGQAIVEFSNKRTAWLRKRHPNLRLHINWAPRHWDMKKAMNARTCWRSEQRKMDLPVSASAAHQAYKARIAKERARWQAESPHSKRIRRFDKTPPRPKVLRWYKDLSRQACSLITQLRNGHAGYLARHVPENIESRRVPCSIPSFTIGATGRTERPRPVEALHQSIGTDLAKRSKCALRLAEI